MKFGIIVFPGTWSEVDCSYAVKNVLNQKSDYVWHKETDLSKYDCIILPGGFSYGDYLRPGAIARFSPVMQSVKRFAESGKYVIGICNGFQILCESGLLPGVLLPNAHLEFRCEWVNLRVENTNSPFTREMGKEQLLKIPISHGEGNFFADNETLSALKKSERVVFRYCDENGNITKSSNPNGSVDNIAGIISDNGNVLGMMPHPERSCEQILGSVDGKAVFLSVISSFSETIKTGVVAEEC